MANRITGAAMVARRRVLLGAGAAVVAMPQVSRRADGDLAVPVGMGVAGHFPRVRRRLRQEGRGDDRRAAEIRCAGGGLGRAGFPDAGFRAGILDGGHGVCYIWYSKHKAASLFGSPPSFGWDAHGILAWLAAAYKHFFG